MIIDKLSAAIRQTGNPVAMGLDTSFSYLPESLTSRFDPSKYDFKEASDLIFEFNKALLDGLKGIIPCVKLQCAYYEMYGSHGVLAYRKTAAYAKRLGYYVIADAKRNDIGATAMAYAKAFLGETIIAGKSYKALDTDFVTVNAFLGSDGVLPFIDMCRQFDKGCFILVRTSNPSAREFQDLVVDGKKLYEIVADRVAEWGEGLIGECGYSSIGAVVGATYPEEGLSLRKQFPRMFFLVPGYGAQGATAKDLAGCFDENGGGAIINASRSLICAYRNERYEGMDFVEAARAEALRMKEEIQGVINIDNR